jgi:diguanylate cyclase (GGDEF)-like protein
LPGDWWALVPFAVMGFISELLYIPLPTGLRITVSFALVLPSFLLYGPIAAAWVNVTASLAGAALRRPTSIVVFNTGQYAYSALAAGLVHRMVAGGLPPDWRTLDRLVAFTHYGHMLLYVFTYFAVNHLLVNTYNSLRSGHRWEPWLENMKWDTYNYLIAVPLGLIFTVMYAFRGLTGALFIFGSMLTVAYVFRLQLSLANANQELTILHEATKEMNSALDKAKVFDFMSASVAKITGSTLAALYLWDDRWRRLVLAKVVGSSEHRLPESVTVGDGLLGQVVAARQPVITHDLGGDAPESGDLAAAMVVPLAVEDQLIGMVLAGSRQPQAFDSEHLRLFTILANQAAVAIENAILYHRTEQLAITDPMTGLYNYRFFFSRLGEGIRKARAAAGHLGLVYLDINDFSQYNNEYGHLAGDSLLRQFAAFLREHIRDSDLPARYAGDEFAIILPDASRAACEQVANRLLSALSVTEFRAGEGGPAVTFSISVGVASYPEDGQTEGELIHLADQVMYGQKSSVPDWGKDRRRRAAVGATAGAEGTRPEDWRACR